MSVGGRLAGKTALVTGAASGLGEAIARRFIAEGAVVILADIDLDGGKRVAADLGGNARFEALDVTKEDSWGRALDSIKSGHGHLDVLVNNAGVTTVGSIESLTLQQFRDMLDIDLIGVFLGCKHVAPLMRPNGGSIINMASMCSIRVQTDLVGYNAAKAAVSHLTKSVALHYAKQGDGIRCNSIHPGAIHTPILDKVMAQVTDPAAFMGGWVARHPIGRLGKPEEIASMAVFLASDESAFATGAEFVVDGGSSL
jgi:NAD(P)-dependent dehydrogenase (short-subunit alcohol dehydrogenase family)